MSWLIKPEWEVQAARPGIPHICLHSMPVSTPAVPSFAVNAKNMHDPHMTPSRGPTFLQLQLSAIISTASFFVTEWQRLIAVRPYTAIRPAESNRQSQKPIASTSPPFFRMPAQLKAQLATRVAPDEEPFSPDSTSKTDGADVHRMQGTQGSMRRPKRHLHQLRAPGTSLLIR